MRYHLTPIRMAFINNLRTNAGENVEKREPTYTVVRNLQWYSHCEQYEDLIKQTSKLKIEVIYDTAIPLLAVYLEKSILQKDTSILNLFQSYLQQPGHGNKISAHQQRIDEEYVVYTHTHTHTHTHTRWNTIQPLKEQNSTICSDMDRPSNCYTE